MKFPAVAGGWVIGGGSERDDRERRGARAKISAPGVGEAVKECEAAIR